ncbi:hypothetical protein ACTNBL_12185, partial [Enterococcus villorum]|uniref:hypothetical protein n=1 Tax=Enterococcus villorum TaxID=112904 RepID=UPI003F8B6B6E
NQRNKRERVENPSLSENTLTTATTPASPTPAINATPEQPTLAKTTTTESPTLSIPETYIQRRNKMLELKFDMVMQETKALNEQFLEIDNFFLSKKKAHDFTLSKTNEDLSLRQDNIKDKLLPKLKNETNLLQDQIMNEKNYINSLVKTGEMSSLKAEEDMNEYDKLTNQFEKLSNQFDVDNRRNITDKLLKQHFPNFTPTTVMNNTFTTKRPTISTPETYIRRRNKMLASDFSKVMEEISDLRNHVNGLITEIDLNVSLKKVYPELYKRLPSDEDLNAKIDDAKNNQLPKLAYERDLVQSQIMNEKNYISSLVKEGKINFLEAKEYIKEYDKLINQFEKPVHDFNIYNAREKIDSLVKQSLSKYTSTIAENNKSTPEEPTISTSETYIRRRNKMLETNLSLTSREARILDRQATDEENDLKMMILETEIKISDIEERRARIDEIRNNQLPKLDYKRGLAQYRIMNEKNYINSLIKEEKMSTLEAESYLNEYDKLINQFEKPIPDINIDNARERIDSLLKQSHLKYAPTTKSPTTATPERTTTSTPESNIRKRIKKLETGSDLLTKEIMALRRRSNVLEKMLLAKKNNPDYTLPDIEVLRAQSEVIKERLLYSENQRTLIQPVLMDEKNSIESLVKEGKISAVEAEEFINRYNGLMDKYKQPIPDINMDNITTTTERTATTTTEIPTLSTSETYIGRRNKILELNFDMVIQETMYLSNKANEIEDMLFLKEQFPDLPLPNSIETLKAQRDEIRGELLPTLVDQRDFVQYQIMNEKDSIESLVKEGKMSAVEAEKYRNEYNKLIDKFEVPVNVFGHEFDNIRKKRDLSLEQSFSEKSVNIATDNKEKPRLSDKSANKATDKKEKQRLSKKLESITTNNKQNVLRRRSVMKREPVIAR